MFVINLGCLLMCSACLVPMVTTLLLDNDEPSGGIDDGRYLHLLDLIADEKAERKRLENEVTAMESKMVTIEAEMTSLKQKIRTTGTAAPNVAFRAMLSQDLGSVTANHVIIFDDVHLNLGNAYDIRHGTFTAPYNGTYMFSMALGNPTGNGGTFFMKKNGLTIEYAFAGQTSGWNMGGVTTVAELAEDDDVWVEGEQYVSGTYPDRRFHTGFSGILIHAF